MQTRGETKELIPNSEYDFPTIASERQKNLTSVYSEVLHQETVLRNLFGDYSADIGSNSWVVAGNKTDTGIVRNIPIVYYIQSK